MFDKLYIPTVGTKSKIVNHKTITNDGMGQEERDTNNWF